LLRVQADEIEIRTESEEKTEIEKEIEFLIEKRERG